MSKQGLTGDMLNILGNISEARKSYLHMVSYKALMKISPVSHGWSATNTTMHKVI